MSSFFRKPQFYKPGIGGSILILLVLIVGGGILGAIIPLAVAAFSGELTTEVLSQPEKMAAVLTGRLSLSYFSQMIIPVIFIWLVGNVKSQNPLEAPVKVDAPHIGSFNVLSLGFILLLMTLGLSWVLDPVTSFFPMPDNFKDMFESIGSKPFDTILSVAIMAPLFEEFVLRGTIERGLLAKGSVAVAIIWSALLFGIMHMNLWQAIPAFVIGCFLGWVYYRSHSIWAVIFIHFVNNFSSIMMFWAFPKMDPEASSRENLANLTGSDAWYWILVGAGAVIVAAGIYLLDKYLPKKPQSFKPKDVLLTGPETFTQNQTV